MNGPVFLGLLLAGIVGIVLSFTNARSRAVLAQDGFTHPGRRVLAMGLLGGVLLLTVAIPFAGGLAGARPETKDLSIVSIFVTHIILMVFLLSYFFLSGRRSIADFFHLSASRPADLGAGALIGILGWLLFLVAAAGVGIAWNLLRGSVPGESPGEASPLIEWIVTRPLGVKVGIIFSAMVSEELFFRSFLQTRVGAVAATLMFTAAHGVYGEPVALVGILVISAVLSITFRVFGKVLPCVVAHGVFDGLQMFVLIPMALRIKESGFAAALLPG